jgi:glycolate oxidase FAD binding subunit
VTLVTGTGAVLKLGGRVMKNVAGFDLVRMVVGSRGSLGVVVSVCIRVFPRPTTDRVLTLEGGLSEILTAARAVATAPVVPASAVVHAPSDGSRVGLVVRLHGSPAVVDADEAVLEHRVGRPFRTVDGEAAAGLVETVRDACSDDPVLLRLTALPASLPDLVARASDGPFLADVLTGEVRLAPRDVSEGALRTLVGRARELGGSARFLAAPRELAGLARVQGPADALVAKLHATFDPQGVLCPGAPA